MESLNSIKLIPLDQGNIMMIKDIVITESQAAFENQTERHVNCLLNPIPGRTVLGFALKKQQTIIGCFRLILSPEEDQCSLSAFAISMEFQNQGYGKKSLVEIIDYVSARYPKANVFGLSVNSKNTTAKRLYEKCGFEYHGPFEEHGDTYRLKLRR
ncbi:MAG: GNAT family N-acetyltransferase [Pseudobacteriovorax sp.]|nr:GNAT family N-acetyltransferase [Pseudobacteriovorax sp.]